MKRQNTILIVAVFGVLLGWAGAATYFAVPPGGNRITYAEPIAAPESLASAEEIQEAFRTISAAVLPSVVEVSVEAETSSMENEMGEIPWNDFFSDPSQESPAPRYFRSQGLGSGVIVAADGPVRYVLTNAHVVGTNPRQIRVELSDGAVLDAELVGVDIRKDLALLSFETADGELRPVAVGDSDRVYVGDWVLAFGSPYGYEQSVSSGIVSALGRRDGPGDNINDFIQTDAAINQGNSGGALVNIRGELVGINTFITTPNSGSIGLGFAIPVNNAMSTVRQLIETGEVRYGWLGVSLGAFGPEAGESLGYPVGSGSLVYQVFEGSPAWNAGLQPGDLVTALDGKTVDDTDRLIYRIGDKAPGETARFTVSRFGEILELKAVMGARGDEEAVAALHSRAFPGFVAAPLTEDLAAAMGLEEGRAGVPVAEVYPRTRVQMLDLRPGDIIIAIDGRTVTDLQSLYGALRTADMTKPVYSVIRDGGMIELAINEGGRP